MQKYTVGHQYRQYIYSNKLIMKAAKFITSYVLLFAIFGASSILAQERTAREEDGFFDKVKSVKRTAYEAVVQGNEVSKGASSGYQIRTYSTSGVKLEVTDYNADDTPGRTQKYTLDKKDNPIELIDQMGDMVIKKVNYTYDKKGHMLEKITYTGDGEIDSKQIFVHNKKGQVTEQTHSASRCGALTV